MPARSQLSPLTIAAVVVFYVAGMALVIALSLAPLPWS